MTKYCHETGPPIVASAPSGASSGYFIFSNLNAGADITLGGVPG
jgi:hypothetical protein